MVCRRYENVVGEGAQVLCGGPCGKFSKLGARSGPHTRSAHLIPSRSDVLTFLLAGWLTIPGAGFESG